MDQACARFERFLKRRFGQSSTPLHYLNDLKIFINIVGNKEPELVTPEDLDIFVEKQLAECLSAATINRRLASIRSLFEYLASENSGHPWPNPVVPTRHRLKRGSRLPRDVPDEDVAKIIAVLKSARDRAMFGLMVGAGLRVGEVANLRLLNIEESVDSHQMAKLIVCGKGGQERVVWLTQALWETLQDWLRERPVVDFDAVFLNWRGKPISVNGIQYLLAQYCQKAGVTLSCHRLRHTFARRLVENGMSVDSLAKLLGHRQLQTTQRYIDGADPIVRSDFAMAMQRLETTLIKDHEPVAAPISKPIAKPQPRKAQPQGLEKLRLDLEAFPPEVAASVDAYLSWRWPNWRAQTAMRLGRNFLSILKRIWEWLNENRQIKAWEDIHRLDVEAWLEARHQSGVSNVTIQNELVHLRCFLRFLGERDQPVDSEIFRIQIPRKTVNPLPRHLSEADYRWLELNVLQATKNESYDARFDRACFLMLAHTGIRLSEFLDLRLEDIDLGSGYAAIRHSKLDRDRVVYFSPQLKNAIQNYLQVRPKLLEEDRVFVLHGRSPSPRTIQRRLTIYGQQVGVIVSPHILRHTFATRLLNQGIPIHSLRKLLGHKRLDTTQVYARVYDETLFQQFQDAMSCLETKVLESQQAHEEQDRASIIG
jgi:site-specific recombinase XerD